MTAEQLLRLAELNEQACDYIEDINPALACRFAAAAAAARRLAQAEADAQNQAHMYTLLEELKAAVD